MKTFLRIFIFLLILLVGIAGLAFYWTFYHPLPDYQSNLNHPELHQQVDIHWDDYGVPHIYAQNRHDLYYSMGYVHAQDRLWQMTVNQLAAEGRFAEFFGEALLPLDKLQRTIGFWRTAREIEATLPETTRSYLQAYADGVNAFVDQHPKSLPIQFTLADIEPIPWSTTHSVAMARLMAWDLNVPWKSELTYAYLSENLPGDKFYELLPNSRFISSYEISADTSRNWSNTLLPLLQSTENLRKIRGIQGLNKGSNAWAISPEKSVTNAPLLAGDPHLGLSMPGTWYEVHLNVDGRNLSGASLAGAPLVILGQNDHLAWSLTNIMLDDTDFYEEAIHPENNNQYVLDSLAGDPLYNNFQVQQEVIQVKDGDDVLFTRRLSKHGPVISDIFPEQEYTRDRVITMQWTGHEVSNEIDALFTMGWAQSLEEFRRGVRQFKVPGQNFIYADQGGNIARFSQASVPIRTSNPVLFRNGWDPSLDWQGYVPNEELPTVINPDNGWVANANQTLVGPQYPYYLSIYWQPDSRYSRIQQYLRQDNLFTPEAFQQMQNDSYSIYSRDLVNFILPVLKKDDNGEFKAVISYLENWDYSYEASETAASIMDVFLLRLSANTFQDEMGAQVYQNFIQFSALPSQTLMRFLQNGSSFFDDVQTATTEGPEEIILRSMNEAVNYLRSNFGDEPFEWRWEQLHTLTLKPALLGQAAESPDAPSALKVIVDNLLNQGPLSTPGNNTSINVGQYSWNDPFEMTGGPSIRRIIDLSNLHRSWSILPTGQSGNPFSAHYGDQTDSWLNGQYKFMYQDSTLFDETPYKTMTLTPE